MSFCSQHKILVSNFKYLQNFWKIIPEITSFVSVSWEENALFNLQSFTESLLHEGRMGVVLWSGKEV